MIFAEPPKNCGSRLRDEMEVCVNDFSFLYCVNTQTFRSTKLKKKKMVCCMIVCVSVCMYVSVCVCMCQCVFGGRGCVGDC